MNKALEFSSITPDLALMAPELVLAIGAMFLLMLGVFRGRSASSSVTGLALAVLIIAGLWLVWFTGEGTAFNGAFVVDPFARLMKVLALTGSAAAIAMSVTFMRRENFDLFEYPVLIVLATTGMMLMISANNLLSLYLGLELQSLALYVVAAI
ncbi:MAG: NADH-quinone oxidoreductase subunit N, partial [Rhizobiaceae bacterium]|nr:NADH-quinone oxidoreductase subunit N [Rhizobiaceae bacterium]